MADVRTKAQAQNCAEQLPATEHIGGSRVRGWQRGGVKLGVVQDTRLGHLALIWI